MLISPNQGSTDGGTLATITGTNLSSTSPRSVPVPPELRSDLGWHGGDHPGDGPEDDPVGHRRGRGGPVRGPVGLQPLGGDPARSGRRPGRDRHHLGR